MYGYKSWSVGQKNKHCLKLIQMRFSFDVILDRYDFKRMSALWLFPFSGPHATYYG